MKKGRPNHLFADAKYKLIRACDTTDASVHDSQKLDKLLDKANVERCLCRQCLSGGGNRGAARSARIQESHPLSWASRSGASRNRPLSAAQQTANQTKSRVRARIEHVFAAQENTPGGRLVRTIGICE